MPQRPPLPLLPHSNPACSLPQPLLVRHRSKLQSPPPSLSTASATSCNPTQALRPCSGPFPPLPRLPEPRLRPRLPVPMLPPGPSCSKATQLHSLPRQQQLNERSSSSTLVLRPAWRPLAHLSGRLYPLHPNTRPPQPTPPPPMAPPKDGALPPPLRSRREPQLPALAPPSCAAPSTSPPIGPQYPPLPCTAARWPRPPGIARVGCCAPAWRYGCGTHGVAPIPSRRLPYSLMTKATMPCHQYPAAVRGCSPGGAPAATQLRPRWDPAVVRGCSPGGAPATAAAAAAHRH